MSDWTESDLAHWDDKILRIAADMGLDDAEDTKKSDLIDWIIKNQ